jgi:hypothetical protein
MGGVFVKDVNNGYGWGVYLGDQQWAWVGCFLRRLTVGMGGVFFCSGQ